MALSQLLCLDEQHVNPRVTRAKPDFLYCEDQRLALETLLRDGREGFFKHLEERGLRDFLSDPELDALRGSAERYQPGAEVYPEDAAEGDPPLSLHYWPDLSDTSAPRMDLGWPDSAAYRGVTRAAVYCQPPLDGQTHIKEVVRRMIAQAQKVIAVVMDVFTDVDIFQDLLDVSFKKRVSVYILLDRTALPHFLSMCQRANMHAGHLKHLRIRCSGGSEFYTRFSTRVTGKMGHRFMFIDGDKAVSGSYSFTWMSSRLDRNLITVVTGQAVETFDNLFCILYANSSLVDLQQVSMEPEPEPEKDPLPQPATVAPLSAALAMKLYNPKYSLALCSSSTYSSPSPAADEDNAQKTTGEGTSKNPDDLKKRRGRASKESLQEPPPLPPCLSSLEKVCLISFLPTWPEPDPPSDVIGFINIRDTSKPLQVHLQRSEMFETSQVIRFSSPISVPKEDLPAVAKPRKLTAKQDEVKKLSQGQITTGEQPQACLVDMKRKLENDTPSSEMQCKSVRDGENELNMNMKESGPSNVNTAPHLSKHKTDKPNKSEGVRLTTQVVTPSNSSNIPGSNTKVCESKVNADGFNMAGSSQLASVPIDSNTGQSVHITEMTPNLQNPNSSLPTQAHSSSMSSPLLSSFANADLPPSSESSSPPTPKPRTIQLVIKDTVHGNGQKLQEVSIVRKQQTKDGPNAGLQIHNDPASRMDLWSLKESENLQNNIETVRDGKPGEAQCKNVRGNCQETEIEEVLHDVKAKPKSMQVPGSSDSRAGAMKRLTDQEKVRKDEESTLDRIDTVQSGSTKRGPTGFESPEVTRENRKNVKQKAMLSGGHTLQKIPQSPLTQSIESALDTSGTHNPYMLAEESTQANDAVSNGYIPKELTLKSPASTFSSDISLSTNLSKPHKKDLHLRIPDGEQSPSPLGRSPSVPTRLHTPDRSCTPDFRTPTSDVSEGYASPRTLSTTSDEYFECSDFPFYEAFEHADVYSWSITEDDLRFLHANTTKASNISSWVTDVTKTEGDTGERLAEPSSTSSSSLLDDVNVMKPGDKSDEKESSTTDTFRHSKNLTEVLIQEHNRKKPSNAERLDDRGVTSKRRDSEPSSTGDTHEEELTVRDEPATTSSFLLAEEKVNMRESVDLEVKPRGGKKAQRRDGKESKSTTDTSKNGKNLTEVPYQDTKGKSPSKAEILDEKGLASKKLESKTPSRGDAREEKMTARNKIGGIKETEEQKLSHTSSKQDRGAGSRSPRTTQSGTRTLPYAPPVADNTETPQRFPRTPPPEECQRQKTRQQQNKNPSPISRNPHAEPNALQPCPNCQRTTFPAGETQCQVHPNPNPLFSSPFNQKR